MTVTNRKMFKRDARDKVRQMGGIMSSSAPLIEEVARFQFGGNINLIPSIVQGGGSFPGPGKAPPGGPPYATAIDPQRTFMGVKLPDFIKTDSNINTNMPNYNIMGNPGGANINLLPTVAETGDTFTESLEKVDPESDTIEGKAKKGLINFGEYAQTNPAEAASFLGLSIIPGAVVYKGLKYTPQMFGGLKNILFGSKVRTAGTLSTAGGATYVAQDEINEFLKEDGLSKLYQKGQEQLKKLPENITQGKKVVDEFLGIEGPDAKTSQDPGQLGLKGPDAKANLTPSNEVAEIIKKAQATTKDGPQYPEQLGDNLKTLDPNRRAKPESLPGTADRLGTLGVTADESAEFEGKAVNEKIKNGEADNSAAQKLVEKVINNGVGTKGLMKQTIDEFMGNVEEYKGMDRGLAIAKIGFAMAAGKSSNAITNIAEALSQGADMFIKDDAQRDAWRRQVNLAAVQYGMGEVSKAKTQARADARNFESFVVGKGGYTDRNGTFHKEGKMVELSMAERLRDASKMNNLESLTAIKEKSTLYVNEMKEKVAELELLKAMGSDTEVFKEGLTSDKAVERITEYTDIIGQAEDATRAEYLFKYVRELITDEKTGPFRAGAKGAAGTALTKFYTLLGLKPDKTWATQELAESAILGAMGDITSIILGKTQSANSISDRDVLFNIIRPYMGGLVKKDSDGNFSINLAAEPVVLDQIDLALSKIGTAKNQALNKSDVLYHTFSKIPQVKGTRSSLLDFMNPATIQRRQAFGAIGSGKGAKASPFEFDVKYDKSGSPISLDLISTAVDTRETS